MNGAQAVKDLHQIIAKEEISTVFQPIINLKTGGIKGYEALSRGPEGSPFENSAILFQQAKKERLPLPLDGICLKKSQERSASIRDVDRLFINVAPLTIYQQYLHLGAGYTYLQSKISFQFDYIKLDKSLTHSIHQDTRKQHLLHSFLQLGKKVGAK